MTTHDLKTWPPYFEDLLQRRKTFELRHDDRGFAVGDVLRLREWRPDESRYTGRELRMRVTYVLRAALAGLQEGYVILGVEPHRETDPVAQHRSYSVSQALLHDDCGI